MSITITVIEKGSKGKGKNRGKKQEIVEIKDKSYQEGLEKMFAGGSGARD